VIGTVVNAARDAVNSHTDSGLSQTNAKVDALSSKLGSSGVGFNTKAFCAEGSVRSDPAGTLQMYVTVFSETNQTVRIDYITNKGLHGHDIPLTANVRYTDDVNGFLVHPGGALAGQSDVDVSVRVTAPQPIFLACPLYFNRTIGDAGQISGGTVQDGSHN
jgi:hypothetical protein